MTKKRGKIIIIIIAILIMIISFSTDLCLRTAIFIHAPSKTFTVEYEKDNPQPREATSNKVFYHITKNNIKNNGAGAAYLNEWVVYRFGPFHFARYVSWGA